MTQPLIAILLATFNGERFLRDQLTSIESQTHHHWVVFASDDGSSDKTIPILLEYQKKWGAKKLEIIEGPGLGFVENFMSLLTNSQIRAEFYAFSDQDDIWLPEKLSRALGVLNLVPKGVPSLYGGRTVLIDEQGKQLGQSPLFRKSPSFENALVQSIMGGNTMVMNATLRNQLTQVQYARPLPSHDWWCYIFVTAIGGYCFYDEQCFVMYRQHQQNLVGGNTGWANKIRRLRMVLKGQFRSWSETHAKSLEETRQLLPESSQEIFKQFQQLRYNSLAPRLRALKQGKFYRQNFAQNIVLFAAVVLRKA